MIDFAKLKELAIPEGRVFKLESKDGLLWKGVLDYVSLGDSIAAGHSINDDWAKKYGTGSQYGENGNTQTVVVPKSYTALIAEDSRIANVKSFAHSGDRIPNLMDKLSHQNVINAIKEAGIVTISIGANDVLEPAMSNLEKYINSGDSALAEISATVNNNLANLANDNYAYSMTALLNRLYAINPRATYIFTTVYNPYKYLWIEDGDQGFFKPVLDTIPPMEIDVDDMIENMFGIDMSYPTIENWNVVWHPIELSYSLHELIKSGFLNTPIVRLLFNRVNGLCDYSENLVVKLNQVLVNKINAYGKPNFKIVDTKALFDLYPDRPVPNDVHYNDLVNVEFTRGYNTMSMDWGALWRDTYGTDAAAITRYWSELAAKHTYWHNAFPSTNVGDYVDFEIDDFAADLVTQTIEKVIVPNVDPHPEEFGHLVLKNSFERGLWK